MNIETIHRTLPLLAPMIIKLMHCQLDLRHKPKVKRRYKEIIVAPLLLLLLSFCFPIVPCLNEKLKTLITSKSESKTPDPVTDNKIETPASTSV